MKPRNEESIKSKQLDKELQIVHRQFEKAIKILLLGTAESGKTTILQQVNLYNIIPMYCFLISLDMVF